MTSNPVTFDQLGFMQRLHQALPNDIEYQSLPADDRRACVIAGPVQSEWVSMVVHQSCLLDPRGLYDDFDRDDIAAWFSRIPEWVEWGKPQRGLFPHHHHEFKPDGWGDTIADALAIAAAKPNGTDRPIKDQLRFKLTNAGAAVIEEPWRHAGRGDAVAPFKPKDEKDIAILSVLMQAAFTLTQEEITYQSNVPEATVKRRLRPYEVHWQLVHRPNGPKGGYAMSPQGREIVGPLLPAAVDPKVIPN